MPSSELRDAAGSLGSDGPVVIDSSTVGRTALVTPSLCGTAPFVGRLGDWTWEAVTALCDINVLAARNCEGQPAYLSFYYIRLRASQGFHVGSLTFGDQLRITSGLFNFGSESILTLHTARRADADAPALSPIRPQDFYRQSDENCIYVENFNRWISRSREQSNVGLVRASPPGFRYQDLPPLPGIYSPRVRYDAARTRHTFLDEASQFRVPSGTPTRLRYRVDASRDLNGVGLLYFAAYFSIVDWALLRHWRRHDRGLLAFLDRVILSQELCYLGNADPEAVLAVEVSGWHSVHGSPDEVVTVVIAEQDTDRIIAVSTIHVIAGARS